MSDIYFPLFVFFVLAAGFVVSMLVASILIGPKKYSEKKDDPFECGTVGVGNPSSRFSVRFYLVALTFVLFDLEVVFLVPWALGVADGGWGMYAAVIPFFLLLTVGLVYDWRRGVLDWV